MPSDSPTDSDSTDVVAAAPTPSQTPKKKKKKKKAKIARPLEEREINAPDKQTLYMLGSLAAMAVVLWVFAHAGCNYHPPRETRVPRKVTTADLTREPKDAAIELQQRLATLDYKGALEIAAGPLKEQIEAEKAACEKDRAACETRKTAAEGAISYGVVLTREPTNAKVRVITQRAPDGPKKYLTLVERDAAGWKITARIPDTEGAKLPAPVLPPAFRVMTAPMGAPPSGAPATPGSSNAPAQKPALPPGHP